MKTQPSIEKFAYARTKRDDDISELKKEHSTIELT